MGEGDSEMGEKASRKKPNMNLLAQDANDLKDGGWGLQGTKCRQNSGDRGHHWKYTGYHRVLFCYVEHAVGTPQVN